MRIGLALPAAAMAAAWIFAAEAPWQQPAPAERSAIEAAAPRQAPARPLKPRRVLIVSGRDAREHPGMANGNYALALMGKQTGAYEAVLGSDEKLLRRESLERFDAVVLNNTVSALFRDQTLREALLDFVRRGKGLASFHATAPDEFPELAGMLGAFEGGGHPWKQTDSTPVKIDEPRHPLNAAFNGLKFEVAEEALQLREPALRNRLRVLLSIDVPRTDARAERGILKERRQDLDFPISWITSYGEGRIFSTTMGHNPKAFERPELLAHYLAGIQFVSGDLKAEASTNSRAPAPPDVIGYHLVKTDPSGRLAPWYGSGPAQSWDKMVRLVFDFWKGMRNCENGVPYYLQHQVWKPVTDDARAIGGDQIPMALSSWNLLYGYLGDESVKQNMQLMADYWLAHGMSAPDLLWGNLPYPYNLDVHSGRYDGDMRAGKGYLQPDKAASFGAELVVLYKMTGNRKYLDAAAGIASTLARRIRPGDAENAPWPYRVNAASGEVHKQEKDGKIHAASYTTNYTSALRLFDDLAAMGLGDAMAYAAASKTLMNWLATYPLKTNKWGPFFEDINTADYSDTEINADTMAAYILEHPELHADWRAQARGILDWSYRTFENKEYAGWGVNVINEQTAYRVPGNSHTSRHASVELLYCEKTGDCAAKDDAIRRLDWATYTVDRDGKNRYIRDDNWLTDGYGDYVRHYLRAMASAPETAPADQNHLLRTTSVMQSVSYGPRSIRYTKFDSGSTETFKMGAWTPKSVRGGKMEWNAGAKVLTVRAAAKSVVIE